MPVPTPIPFDELREFFADEGEYGQLCDIHVPDADRNAWAVFLKVVVPEYSYHFSLSTESEETPQPLPDDPMSVLLLAGSEEGPGLDLSLDLLSMRARVLFHDPTFLEVDFERAEVTPRRYELIVELMRRMGDAMRHDVFLTTEGQPWRAAMVYQAEKRWFRRPRRGMGVHASFREANLRASDLRKQIIGEIRAAVAPLLSAPTAPPLCDPPLPDTLLIPALARIESLQPRFGELALQDALTAEERVALQRLWSNIATIVPPGAATGRRSHETQVLELARLFC